MQRFIQRLLAVILAAMAFVPPATGETVDDEMLREKLDAYLDPLVASTDFAGTVLIDRGGETLIRGYGLADREAGRPNGPDTVFHIASVTKPITAVAVLRLHQDGRIDLFSPISRYLPKYPRGDEITVAHLLTQVSGIPSYNRFPDYGDYASRENTLAETVAWFSDEPLLFEPGSEYGYSNSNYVLLAHLVETVTGEGFDGWLKSAVFDPAGMNHTFRHEADHRDHAVGYDPTPTSVAPAAPYNKSLKIGSGHLSSTVGDLLALVRALEDDTVLDADRRRLLWSDPYGVGYGFGWGTRTRFGRPVLDHDGASPGAVAYLSHYPEDETTIIFLGNISTGAFHRMKSDLAAIVFGEPWEAPASRRYVDVSAETLERFEGRFGFPSGSFFDLVVDDAGALRFRWMGRGEGYFLSPLSETAFYMRARGDELRFVRANGRWEIDYVERGGVTRVVPRAPEPG